MTSVFYPSARWWVVVTSHIYIFFKAEFWFCDSNFWVWIDMWCADHLSRSWRVKTDVKSPLIQLINLCLRHCTGGELKIYLQFWKFYFGFYLCNHSKYQKNNICIIEKQYMKKSLYSQHLLVFYSNLSKKQWFLKLHFPYACHAHLLDMNRLIV